jgi:hypothetical protein
MTMKRFSRNTRRSTARIAMAAAHITLGATVLLAPAMLLLPTAQAHAQAATFRSVTGDVTDKAGNKVKGAVVHLKDTHSLSQRSYITAEDGQFKFGQISTNSDYEIWADLTGKKTDSKSLSSFDSKKAVEISLKMPD